jgi:hypothetical protein
VFYDNNVLDRVANAFKDDSIDYVYGDIVMVSNTNDVKRYWKAGPLSNGRIASSQIPHPGLFMSRKLLMQIKPPFDISYRISADLKQQLIFANILHAKGVYIPEPLVKMTLGGTSTINLRAYLKGWHESRRAWNEVHGHGGALYVVKKVLSKVKGIRG